MEDQVGLSLEQLFEVKIPEEFSVSYEVLDGANYCNDDDLENVRFRVFGGTPPYNWILSDFEGNIIENGFLFSSFSNDLVFFADGEEYTLGISDSNGCSGNVKIVAEIETTIQFIKIVPELTPPTSASTNDGTIIAHVSGGVKPYEYSWLNGDGLVTEDSIYSNLLADVYFFRCTDAEGCEKVEIIPLDFVSNVASINLEWNIALSPNPCTDLLNIYIDSNQSSEPMDLIILNNQGQEVLRSQLNQYRTELKVDQLTSGIFMAQFTQAGKSTVQKFVKL